MTITGHVSGNVAFLNNGIPTVVPGPIANAGVVAGPAINNNSSAVTDQQGNFTLSVVVVGRGETISIAVVALSYLQAIQNITLSTTSATVSFVLSDDPSIVNHRMPLFDGTGDGAVDQAGNEYHYLGRGEYYATIGGQTEYFTPQSEPERYYCAALDLFYYASDYVGTYGLNGGCFARSKGGVSGQGELTQVYVSYGGSVYVSEDGVDSFKPLP